MLQYRGLIQQEDLFGDGKEEIDFLLLVKSCIVFILLARGCNFACDTYFFLIPIAIYTFFFNYLLTFCTTGDLAGKFPEIISNETGFLE